MLTTYLLRPSPLAEWYCFRIIQLTLLIESQLLLKGLPLPLAGGDGGGAGGALLRESEAPLSLRLHQTLPGSFCSDLPKMAVSAPHTRMHDLCRVIG